MTPRYRIPILAVSLTLALVSVGVTGSQAASITIRSGNVAPTATDPVITYLVEPSGNCNVPFAGAFGPADFAAADAGPPAWSLPAHSAWVTSLSCDPAANWISTAPGWPSRSTLYSVPFNIPLPAPCCIESATLDFCWAADDILGDPAGNGPNPFGVYLNGTGLGIAGGNYSAATRVIIDIKTLLNCGDNRLYVYNRDLGCAVAGAIFSATINYTECITPVRRATWGSLRSLYR